MVFRQVRFQKSKWYPRPHQDRNSYAHGLETAVANRATITPIIMYDEAQGTPSTYNANPEHASFAAFNGENCFPDSRVDNIFCEYRFSLTKAALETDKVTAIRIAFMKIHMAFKESYIAIDELTSLEVQDILMMQTEATDNQGFPLYNTVKMVEKFSGSATLPAATPGLT